MSSSARTPQKFLDDHGLVRPDPRPIPDVPISVAALVDHAAEAHGDRRALVDRRATFSFDKLREAVDRAADVLESVGVRPLDRVAMCLPNTVDVVVGFLAVMRLGAVWVGINTHLAPPEKQFLLEDSGAAVLVATPDVASTVAHHNLTIVPVNIESPGSWWEDGETTRRGSAHVDPNGPAAIAYTSGTTGRPKGVVHSQHNMLLSPAAMNRLEPDPLVQGTILPLTILNMQILSTVQSLLSGGVLVPIDRADAVGVASWIAEFGVQRMYASPPTVYDFLTKPEIRIEEIASLSHLLVGGAKCPDRLRERYRERSGRDFGFGYGLTEAPTGVTGYSPNDGVAPVGSSGMARDHVDVTIRDVSGAVLSSDEEGEICVGPSADGVFAGCYSTMLGYWNHPERTRNSLRDGVLHTGDIGRINEDGVLWVLDRRSDLIVRGGANVYPAEIERVVEELEQVAEVAVVPRQHDRLGEEVVGMVLPAVGTNIADLDVASLNAACLAQLAKYKVPIDWYLVEQFPRNAMGKVVKPLLRAWLEEGSWPADLPSPEPLA